MKQVRIGLIGTGYIGKAHAIAYAQAPTVFNLQGQLVREMVAEVTPELAAERAQAFGFRRSTGDWRELVADPNIDVVDICSPNHLHKEMALAAIRHGKHVYSEKPLALNAHDAREMVEAAKQAGVKTLVGFNYMKNPTAALAKEIIARGEIGDVIHFYGTHNEDYMADRVVLDAQTAFNLFGSSDVAGMEVTINGRNFPIAGVVQSESDFATNAALAAGNEASGDTSGSSTSTAMIYMSYSALNAMAELPIDCYEIVLPDPVSGFAKKLMTEKFPIGGGAIVQNTGRFSVSRLISVMGAFGKRAMTTNGVIYPYWENAARMAESYAALYLLLGTLLAIMPAVCLTVVLVKCITAEARKGYYKAAHAIEDRVEENKRKHYIAGGI